MTEKELLDDILESFRLPKAVLKELEDYERELIYETYHRYDKKYLQDLLFRAKFKGYNSISKNVQAPEPQYLTRPTEYIIKKKPKIKGGEYINEKVKNKDKKICL